MLDSVHANQRTHPRVAAVFHYSLEIDGKLYFGQTGNISLGGVYLESCTPRIPNEALGKHGFIRLAVGAKPLEFECDIAYSKGTPTNDGVGLRFHRVGDRNYAFLEKFISERH